MAMTKAQRIAKRIRTLVKKYTDVHVYTQEEWIKSPKHEYGDYALVHLTFEGTLYYIINGYGTLAAQESFMKKFRQIIEQYGCYYEQATHWAIYIYEDTK